MSNIENTDRVVEESVFGPLRIVTKQEQPPTLIVEGRVTVENAHLLEDELKRQSGLGEHNLVVNLSQTQYLSSAGLRTLVSGLRENKKNRGNLLIESPSERADAVLKQSGLDSVFQIRRSEIDGSSD